MRADLHSHTIYSDGVLDIKDLLLRAKQNGLDMIAITDHDVFEGAQEGLRIAENYGIKVIYGMELSTYRNGESIHVLAYYSKPPVATELYRLLQEQRFNRRKRANQMVNMLHETFGFKMDKSFIIEKHSITRGTMAEVIVEQGFAKDKKEVFEKMIGKGCPCYIPSSKMPTEDGIKLIIESGGMPVLAHPCLYNNNDIEEIIKMGIKGIEAVYPRTENRETKYRDLAKKYNLLVTGGSDFHSVGDGKHGDVGDCYIKDQDLTKFIKVLENEY